MTGPPDTQEADLVVAIDSYLDLFRREGNGESNRLGFQVRESSRVVAVTGIGFKVSEAGKLLSAAPCHLCRFKPDLLDDLPECRTSFSSHF
jgi:hypothetical protein